MKVYILIGFLSLLDLFKDISKKTLYFRNATVLIKD